jgi:hypothetical protein
MRVTEKNNPGGQAGVTINGCAVDAEESKLLGELSVLLRADDIWH